MLWSNASVLTSVWNANVNSMIARGTTHVLAFNEPDGTGEGQANMSPKAAAEAYLKWMQPLAGRVKLGAPVVTNAVGSGVGLDWYQQFKGNCTACTIDFVPIHWYEPYENTARFESYVQTFHNAVQLPIWVTEFSGLANDGSWATQDQQNSFLETVLPFLDAQSYVERYAYYFAADGFLLSTGTTLSETGVTYNTYTD